MKIFLVGLSVFLMLGGVAPAAEEEMRTEQPVYSELSEEELQLLEVLEMLQNYDLLDEIDVLTVMEEDQ